ncbi:MAG: hypothetical protein ACFCD0_24825 [Gemmataceae bacterium]
MARNQSIRTRITISQFRLLDERRVDIQYYQLTVYPGDPTKQVLLVYSTQGDIRIDPESPRVGSHPDQDAEFLGQPAYTWLSGSILEPTHPWRNSGFSIRLTLSVRNNS